MHFTDLTEPASPTPRADASQDPAGAAALAALSAAALLAACGGGGEPPEAMRSGQAAKAMPELLGGSRSGSSAAARVPTADELMDWAERQFTAFFPGHAASQASGALVYRFYPGTGIYLGVLNGDVLALGPVTGGQVANLGRVADFADLVFAGSGGSVDSDEAAARFLHQAAFGASEADIAAVRSKGYVGWLDEQLNMPMGQTKWDWLVGKGYSAVNDREYFFSDYFYQFAIWRDLFTAPDMVRQRWAFALSEMFVISVNSVTGVQPWCGLGGVHFWDTLARHGFGNFRDLLEAVTLHPMMGAFLNTRGNQKEDPATGRVPDENYAREVMQLFTIGLVQLNSDGSPKLLADGRAQYTYNQEHVTALAQVFTGWDFNTTDANADPGFMRLPMRHIATRFATGDKSVLGTAIPASADGPTALNMALDTLANHPNVGPFIGRQLIQRLVCSSPSPAYVSRVAAAFADNGKGQRGDMKAVIRAVLLDPEAIVPTAGAASGKLREPVLRFVQWGRTFGVASPTDLWNVGDTSNPGSRLGQSPLRSPSVFNFFRPGYVPPDSALGANAVTAPEFQLCNETTVAGYLNFMQSVIQNGIGELKPDYTAELPQANDAAALVARYNLLLAGGRLGADTLGTITSAVGSIAASTDTGRLNRVRAAILLVMAAPDYQIQQ